MWEPLQKQSLVLSLKTSAALLYAGEGRLFILRSLSIFKKENVLKSFDFSTFDSDKGAIRKILGYMQRKSLQPSM